MGVVTIVFLCSRLPYNGQLIAALKIAHFKTIVQGWWKRFGCSGFGQTSFSQGKNEIPFLQEVSNKQKY